MRVDALRSSGPPKSAVLPTVEAATFSASRWHRERRKQILAAHPEVRELCGQNDFWVASLGTVLVPYYFWVLSQAPHLSPPELIFHAFGIGSLRANWAVYSGHAIAHGRWRRQVGPFGSAGFNAALALSNFGNAFQILPSYWLLHHAHHTKLGSQTLLDARKRARQGRQTDGDLGISSRAFSPPAHKYSLIVGGAAEADADPGADAGANADDGAAAAAGRVLRRQSEPLHQALNVVVHALAPLAHVGYLAAALRSDAGGADAALRRSLAVQAAGSLCTYGAVAAVAGATGSAAPLLLHLGSSALWLSPLNPNWVWQSPHLCAPGERQPTVSFYPPPNVLGGALDLYLGYENYHVEHHDFPEMPGYLLPRLRAIAPDFYAAPRLRSYAALSAETWRRLASDEFFYACQDAAFPQAFPDDAPAAARGEVERAQQP